MSHNICERCSGLRAPRLNSPLWSVVVCASPCLECMCSTSILWPTTRPLSSRLGYQPPRLGALVVWLPFDEHCNNTLPRGGMYWKIRPPRIERFAEAGILHPEAREIARKIHALGSVLENTRPRECIGKYTP